VLGEDEIKKGEYVLKNLADGSEEQGTIESLLKALS
jgi:histidyl-tRNA synthetase